MEIHFFKYQGTGNDFVILDNRGGKYNSLTETQIKKLCNRRFGIGADGLMMMQNKEGYDFEMLYFNADGKAGSMCGNGGRCMIRFAYNNGIIKYTYIFWAVDGFHEAEIDKYNLIRLKMQDVNEVKEKDGSFTLNTGSPHLIKFENSLQNLDVAEKGKRIRFSKAYAEEGINVNFIEELDKGTMYVRTYERGVENETLSCGTGVTAAALLSLQNHNGFNRVEVKTNGGTLSVEFNKIDQQHYNNIWLCGPATFVYEGDIKIP